MVVNLDLTTGATMSQVTLPNSALGPFGIRPTDAGQPNEVWVANSGVQISVADLAAQKISATIPLPSSIPVSAVPAGIVFSNDGGIAFEALRYFSPDSAGNNGALLIFDAGGPASIHAAAEVRSHCHCDGSGRTLPSIF